MGWCADLAGTFSKSYFLRFSDYYDLIIIVFQLQKEHLQGCELETLVSNGDFFGKNLENWSPNGLLLRSKSPFETLSIS